MRLLNTKTLRLKKFSSSKDVRYAIFSHRWGLDEDEVSFADIEKEDRSDVEMKKGWDKIVKTCAKAIEWGLDWAWVDTCCINRDSSAELEEAINSMFQWYMDSAVCFAFLNDVEPGEDARDQNSTFRKSLWFTRGWTLQELIAPTDVVFFVPGENGWHQIGTKASLANVVTEITNIEEEVLLHRNLRNSSVAKKMSWAANRETTKMEDRAYSLAGIFGVTIAPAYGEGERAFKRLQAEIIKVSNDHSLFAWAYLPGRSYDGSMLAPSPDCFKYSSDIYQVDFKEFRSAFCFTENAQEYTITNNGLRIRLPFIIDNTVQAVIEQVVRPYQWEKEASTKKAKRKTIRAFLCCKFGEGDKSFVSIPLVHKSIRFSRKTLIIGIMRTRS